MRYLIAFFVPPLSVFLCGKIGQGILNGAIWLVGLLTLMFGIGFALVPAAMIHAFVVIASHKGDVRHKQSLQAMEKQSAAMQSQIEQQQSIAQAQLEQQSAIASSQLRATVEASAAVAASNLAATTSPPPIPTRQGQAIEARFQVARDGEILGEYTWGEIQQYLGSGQLVGSDQYFDGSQWMVLG